MFGDVKYSRLAEAGDGTEVTATDGKAFSFESAFKYDSGVYAKKYKSTANFNSAFRYSGNAIQGKSTPGSVQLDMSNGLNGAYMEEGYERNKPSYGLMLTTWALLFLSYVFFAFTSPIT